MTMRSRLLSDSLPLPVPVPEMEPQFEHNPESQRDQHPEDPHSPVLLQGQEDNGAIILPPSQTSSSAESGTEVLRSVIPEHSFQGCSCDCHVMRATSTQSFKMTTHFGTLAVSRSNILSASNEECSACSCDRRHQIVAARLVFPTWLRLRSLAIFASFNTSTGLNFAIRTPRLLEDSDKIWSLINNYHRDKWIAKECMKMFQSKLYHPIDINLRGKTLFEVRSTMI
jgi:hypothetical protein